MKILVCGGAGFIGQNLVHYLLDHGERVLILDKNRSQITSAQLQSFEADLLKPEIFESRWFDGVDSIINLSGKDIFTLWTGKTKTLIMDSRAKVNRNLINFIAGLDNKPAVFISASAAGYYGNRGEAELLEHEGPGQGFLSEVCRAWEAEARRAEEFGMRSVQVRTAPVLLKSGGLLHKLMKSMRFGFTFVFGSGDQWFPWIHMHDLIRIYYQAALDKTLSGPLNACAPDPVRFRDFLHHLIKYKKSVILPFPVWILKLFLRETADVVLFSQKMVPGKLLEKNYRFSYPTLEEAFENILARGLLKSERKEDFS